MNSIELKPRRTFFLVFDRGDDVIARLRRFVEEHEIRGGHFTAIGAVERATIAWWSWTTKEYERREIEEQLEVLSLSGFIAMEGARPRIHAHVALGRRDGIAAGGHLIEATVRPTLEMHVIDLGTPLQRRRDEITGLSFVDVSQP